MRPLLLVSAICLAVPGWAAEEAEEPKPFFEPHIGVTFPVELGHLALEEVHRYENPRLGVSLRYAASDPVFIKIDVYVYDLELTGLGTGIGSKHVKDQFEQAKRDILAMAKKGRYHDVKLLAERQAGIPVGDEPLPLYAAVYGMIDVRGDGDSAYERPSISHLMLTAFRGQFFKIRVTYPKAGKMLGDQVFKDFLPLLGRTLHGKQAEKAAPDA